MLLTDDQIVKDSWKSKISRISTGVKMIFCKRVTINWAWFLACYAWPDQFKITHQKYIQKALDFPFQIPFLAKL